MNHPFSETLSRAVSIPVECCRFFSVNPKGEDQNRTYQICFQPCAYEDHEEDHDFCARKEQLFDIPDCKFGLPDIVTNNRCSRKEPAIADSGFEA